MAKTYKVLSEEGANFAQAEEGAEVALELSEDQERAVVAAGWLEPKGKEKK